MELEKLAEPVINLDLGNVFINMEELDIQQKDVDRLESLNRDVDNMEILNLDNLNLKLDNLKKHNLNFELEDLVE